MAFLDLKTWLVPKQAPRRSRDGTGAVDNCCQSPIHHLPPEILSNIFLQYSSMTRYRQHSLPWINITHVCRHWRKVALNCLELWAKIRFLEPGVTEMLLSRSKDAPLSVSLEGLDKSKDTKMLRVVLRQMSRIRSLELRGYLQATLLSSMPSRAPILEKLVLAADTYLSCGLPARFMADGAPRLKHLEVGGMNVRELSMLPLGPSITHLELRRASASSEPGTLPLTELLNSLEKMTSLQHLRIANSLSTKRNPEPTSLPKPSRRPVNFEALQSLYLGEESISAITTLLPFIRIPETTAVKVHFRDEGLGVRIVNQFLPVLFASWPSKTRRKLEECAVAEKDRVLDDEDDLDFLFCFDDLYELRNPQRCLEISFNKPANTTRQFMDAFHARLDFSSLVFLRLYQRNSFTFEDWTHYGQLLQNLKAVRFDCVHPSAPMLDFFDALRGARGKVYNTTPVVSPSPLPFPALCALEFHLTDFDQEDMRYDHDDILSQRLAHGLRHRPEGHRVTIIDIVKCSNFDGEDMRYLQSRLPDLRPLWE